MPNDDLHGALACSIAGFRSYISAVCNVQLIGEFERSDALFVGPDVFFSSRRVHLATLAARHVIPATYAQREYVEAGGMMSYGTNLTDTFRQVGVYAGHMLKGAKPADLPVVQASKFELVINGETTRMLGGCQSPRTGKRTSGRRCKARGPSGTTRSPWPTAQQTG